MKRLALIFLLFISLCSCSTPPDCTDTPGATPCPRVLFIGNSYTYVNDLPGTFAVLAKAGGHPIHTGMVAPGGWTLAEHLNSPQALSALQSSKWDFVVLQEQSEIPAMETARWRDMYPAARALVEKIRQTGAQPVFFLTWAHRDGLPEHNLPDYESIEYDHTFCVDILTNKNNCANIKVMRLSVYAYEVGTPYSMNHCSQA